MAKDKKRGSKMFGDAKGAVANMPQESRYYPWPKSHDGLMSSLDDTITGIDEQISSDAAGTRRNFKPTKY